MPGTTLQVAKVASQDVQGQEEPVPQQVPGQEEPPVVQQVPDRLLKPSACVRREMAQQSILNLEPSPGKKLARYSKILQVCWTCKIQIILQVILQNLQESCSLARNLATFLQVMQDLSSKNLARIHSRARFLHCQKQDYIKQKRARSWLIKRARF